MYASAWIASVPLKRDSQGRNSEQTEVLKMKKRDTPMPAQSGRRRGCQLYSS